MHRVPGVEETPWEPTSCRVGHASSESCSGSARVRDRGTDFCAVESSQLRRKSRGRPPRAAAEDVDLGHRIRQPFLFGIRAERGDSFRSDIANAKPTRTSSSDSPSSSWYNSAHAVPARTVREYASSGSSMGLGSRGYLAPRPPVGCSEVPRDQEDGLRAFPHECLREKRLPRVDSPRGQNHKSTTIQRTLATRITTPSASQRGSK